MKEPASNGGSRPGGKLRGDLDAARDDARKALAIRDEPAFDRAALRYARLLRALEGSGARIRDDDDGALTVPGTISGHDMVDDALDELQRRTERDKAQLDARADGICSTVELMRGDGAGELLDEWQKDEDTRLSKTREQLRAELKTG